MVGIKSLYIINQYIIDKILKRIYFIFLSCNQKLGYKKYIKHFFKTNGPIFWFSEPKINKFLQ